MNIDAIEKGYYEVIVDGVKVSQHTKPLKAIARAQEEKAKDQSAYIYVKQPNIEPIVEIDESAEIQQLKDDYDMIWAELERFKALGGGTVVDPPVTVLRAFPSAYGAGADATGGRTGSVIHVTTLADSGAGSLREALTATGDRFIIFDVSGVINLLTQARLEVGNVTVNAFSAPLGGITIIGSAIRGAGGGGVNNMIWRGIRFRNGYLAAEPSGASNHTCLGFRESDNVIVDRCSFAYSKEKALDDSTSGAGETATGITFQNCLFGESEQAMLTGNSDGADFGNASILRNVTSNVGWRMPKAGGAMQLDVINNYTNNWQGRTIRIDQYDFALNHIGNYYNGGGLTNTAERPDKKMFAMTTNATMSPQIYDNDNFVDPTNRATGYPATPSDGWYQFPDDITSPDPILPEWWVGSQLPLQGQAPTILAASTLEAELLPKVGACEYLDDNGAVQF